MTTVDGYYFLCWKSTADRYVVMTQSSKWSTQEGPFCSTPAKLGLSEVDFFLQTVR